MSDLLARYNNDHRQENFKFGKLTPLSHGGEDIGPDLEQYEGVGVSNAILRLDFYISDSRRGL